MVTRCVFCGAQTELRRVTAENWWGEKLALVEDVPAWVCVSCGEPFFDAETCKLLDRMRSHPPAVRRTVEVPIYAFSQESK